MAAGYLHVDAAIAQTSRHDGTPCGDVVRIKRDPSATVVAVSDGLGHGIRAHIAAEMTISRLLELLRQGQPLRKAFTTVVGTLEQARGTDMPYATLTVARILSDGMATILTYEMPPPILVGVEYAQVLPQHQTPMGYALLAESRGHLVAGEGLLLVSDGITQAGLGGVLVHGWRPEGVAGFLCKALREGTDARAIPSKVLEGSRQAWGLDPGDDCTAVHAACREGRVVNVLTGPPACPTDNAEVV